MLLDGRYERTAVVLATKNMRELQGAYRLIVESVDQAKNVNKRFVWMTAIEQHL